MGLQAKGNLLKAKSNSNEFPGWQYIFIHCVSVEAPTKKLY